MSVGFEAVRVRAHDGAELAGVFRSGTSIPIVFIHDLADDHAAWQPVMDAMCARNDDITMLAIDLRGHGGSDLGSETSRKRMVKDLRLWIQHLKLSSPVVVGHGYGADIALAADFVDAVVAVNPALGRGPAPHDPELQLPAGMRGARDADAIHACTIGATEAKSLKRSRRDAPLFLVLADPADMDVEGLPTFMDVAEDVQTWKSGSRRLPLEAPLGLAAILLGWELL